jgi:hypothetical protein
LRNVLPASLSHLLPNPPRPGLLCTDVVAYSLPALLVQRIYELLQNTRREPLASGIGTDNKIFFTPNAFAFALGLPSGRHVTRPGQPLKPILLS